MMHESSGEGPSKLSFRTQIFRVL